MFDVPFSSNENITKKKKRNGIRPEKIEKGEIGDSEFFFCLLRLLCDMTCDGDTRSKRPKSRKEKKGKKKNKKKVSHQFVRRQPSFTRPPKPNAANPVLCCCCLYQKKSSFANVTLGRKTPHSMRANSYTYRSDSKPGGDNQVVVLISQPISHRIRKACRSDS